MADYEDDGAAPQCPMHTPGAARSLLGRTNKDWWPEGLPVDILHQGGTSPDPMGADFDYAEAFKSIDYVALKSDLTALMTDSKSWWPADYVSYCRWSRRVFKRAAALCAAQLMAG
jgi:catalase-peroxidase